MRLQVAGRGVGLAAAALLVSATAAFADAIPADGDDTMSGNQGHIQLGERIAGETVTWSVDFRLTCSGLSHAAPGQTATIALASVSNPLDGAADATSTTIGPVPATWTPSGEGCPSPAPTLASNGPSTVTLVMPTTPGTGYFYTLMFSRNGVSGLSGITAITFEVDVIPNTSPELILPGDLTVEATSAAGALVPFSATGTDAEDDPDPSPSCDPSSGSAFALGTTTVACSVADRVGATASGSFDVTVVDTTPPTLSGVPTDQLLATADPAGATVAFAAPSAADAVDPDPAVGCAPASGSLFPVGTTTVTCTATDDAGNTASATFDVVVTYDPGVSHTVRWGEPVGGAPAGLVSNHGRTIPVKAEVFANNGAEVAGGSAALSVAPCNGGSPVAVAMAWEGSDRWAGHLDTARLAGPGCYTATLSVDGHAVGSFALDVRGSDASTNAGRNHRR